jgi:hypothetical protein
MKICPFITQVSILEEPRDAVLLREADDTDLHDEDAVELAAEGETGEDGEIFMNPDVDDDLIEDSGEDPAGAGDDSGEDETRDGEEHESGEEHEEQDDERDEPDGSGGSVESRESGRGRQEESAAPVRFEARSMAGEIRCLGESCRFHDDERGECGIEIMLRAGMDEDAGSEEERGGVSVEMLDERFGSIRGELEKAWDFQQRSTGDILGMFRELGEKASESSEKLRESLESSFNEIKELISSVNEDNKLIVESLSDTLAERSEDLETRLTESSGSIDSFRGEVSEWKSSLDESI